MSERVILFSCYIVVDKQSYMVGCYGPKGEVQTYLTPVAEAPSGMIARGSYK